MYISRKLSLNSILQHKSCFLFGPRQSGKSSLIRSTLPNAQMFDLLKYDTLNRLARNPSYLEEVCVPEHPVVIDKIQKLPELLDEVHRLIETKGMKFLLTGSSARKLRKGGVNLLGAARRRAEGVWPHGHRARPPGLHRLPLRAGTVRQQEGVSPERTVYLRSSSSAILGSSGRYGR